MKERPILFSAPMVRAILEGRKTQTRRTITPGKSQTAWLSPETIHGKVVRWTEGPGGWWAMEVEGGHIGSVRCPYGQRGDRLWVRETWAAVPNTAGCEKYGAGFDPKRSEAEQYRAGVVFEPEGYRYRATWEKTHGARWHPSIHMPRKASRILLEVVSVRVERLQEISEADAQAEGVEQFPGSPYWKGEMHPKKGVPKSRPSARNAYRDLWESINGKGNWDANPWVWVVEFKRMEVA